MSNTRPITGTEAKKADIYAIETMGIPSLELMENASKEVLEYLAENFAEASILILSGTGNNGADGICVAKLILNDDRFTFNPTVLVSGNLEHASWEFLHQLSEYKKLGGIFSVVNADYKFPDADVLVDAVFGIGLQTILREDRAALLRAADAKAYSNVVAIDVPSGINSDNGKLLGGGIHATATITFGRNKTGLTKALGKEYAGEVIIRDIGIPDEAYDHALS